MDQALEALAVYDIGKPLVVEETFPLSCPLEELDKFIDGADGELMAGSAITSGAPSNNMPAVRNQRENRWPRF